MGKLNYIKGDLFESYREVIGHCVNARGAFGSGIAGQIATKYPEARSAYMRSYQQGTLYVGRIQMVKIFDRRFIANMCMQDTYGSTGTHIIYQAVEECFGKLVKWCETRAFGLAIPKVGAGLAGGDWNKIESIIEGVIRDSCIAVDVYHL